MKRLKLIMFIAYFTISLGGSCKSNRSPEVPSIPIGPDSGSIDNYTFSSFTLDPDGDSVSMKFDWGDGEESKWSPFVASEETISMIHYYGNIGSYEIRAKAKDINNAESDWSEKHILTLGAEIIWSKEYGGAGDDFGYSIQKTQDNSYVIVGSTNSFGAGANDVYLVKIDTSGTIIWDKTYGGSADDYGYGVKCTNDGGCIIVGTSKSFGDENGDVYLIKVDAQGNQQWQQIYGGSSADYGYDIISCSDGYAITGMTGSFGAGSGDVWLIKINFDGDTVWTKTYGGFDLDCGYSIQRCSDNGFVIAGYTYSFGSSGDIYLVRTDATGNAIWTKNYGGTGGDIGNMVILTSDNGYLVVGGNGNVYILKLDNNGNKIWERNYGTNYTDNGYAVEQSPDGGCLIVGSAGINGSDLYYLCIDGTGNLVKEKTYGDCQSEYGRFLLIDGATAIIGGYRLSNLIKNNFYVIKIKR